MTARSLTVAIGFLTFTGAASAQINGSADSRFAMKTGGSLRDCGSWIAPDQVPDLQRLQELGMYESAAGQRYILQVPITMHVVHIDNGNGGTSQANLDATLADANAHWLGAGIQFFQAGATIHINSSDFYFNIDTQAEIDALRNTSSIPNTVNAYFTENLSDETGSLCGQGTFTTTGGSQGVAMNNNCTNIGGNTTTFAHELGHFFDLLHTHETAMGAECPNGSNCANAGDLLCDTAADPDLTGNLNGCTYNGTAMRCGSTFNPDPTNLMSYGGACRTHFTYGQHSRALGTLVNLRSNLLNPSALNVTWVDFGYGGTTNGSFNQPFNTLASAVSSVAVGGRVVLKAGSAYQTLTITKACTLDAFRGTATVGQ